MKKASAAKEVVYNLSSPVVGSDSVGRSTSGRFCRVYLGIGDILWPQGAIPQALTLFGGVGFIARRLRRPEKGNADGVRGIFGTA